MAEQKNPRGNRKAKTESANPDYPGVSALIRRELPGIPFTASETKTNIDVTVAVDDFLPLVTGLQRNKKLAFDYLGNIAGVDFEDQGMALKYHLYSFTHHHSVQITVPTPAGRPHVPSIVELYAAADWHEREAAEMFGFIFDGHPELRNLLLDDDLIIFPLLKAHPLQPIEIKQGSNEGDPGFER